MSEDAYLSVPDPATEAELDALPGTPGGPSFDDVDDWAPCPNDHGMQEIHEVGSFTGFAGGRSYFCVLACGCTDLDETNDLNAAY